MRIFVVVGIVVLILTNSSLVLGILRFIFTLVLIRAILDPQPRNLIISSFGAKTKLPDPPTRLSDFSIFIIFLLVILKYVLQPFSKLLDLSPALREDKTTHTFELPYAEISAPLSISTEDCTAYTSSIDASNASSNEQANPLFLLTPLTTPLLLLLLSKQTNQILPFGAVNVRNRFEFHAPKVIRNLRSVQESGSHFTAHAHLGGEQSPGVRVKRGMEFDISVHVVQHDPQSPENETKVFSYIFTVLQQLGRDSPAEDDMPTTTTTTVQDARTSLVESVGQKGKIELDYTAPLGWAKLCKDYNPIHVSFLAAKLFGFKSVIAHGNMVVALVMDLATNLPRAGGSSCYSGSVPRELELLWTTDEPSWAEVSFRRPILLHRQGASNECGIKWLAPSSPTSPVRGGFEVTKDAENGEGKVLVEGRAGLL